MTEFNIISPLDGSVYASRHYATAAEINEALARAQLAQPAWRSTPLAERQRLCRAMVEAFEANAEEIAHQICWQMGRPIQYAAGEVRGLAERARYMIDAAPKALANIAVEDKPGFTRYIKREPLGMVLVIAPWNYPYLTAINSIIPALLAGNVVLLKHSAQTPLCAEQLHSAFVTAGLPPGVFQFLHLTHEDTEKLIAHPSIDQIAFTGSVPGGAMVERVAAGHFKSVGLELGGKDPAYVRADADLNHAVETLVDGAFFNSGQSCCGIERIYVHEDVFDAFVARAVDLVYQYTLGRSDDPATTLGPMVKAAAADFVREQVAEAVAQGARCHIDEARFPLSQPGTPYLAPQLLTQVNHSMRLMTEESFGPVVGVQKVAGDDEAIALMNDSDFGLTAAVFTQDEGAGIAIGEQVETGTFFINRCDYLDPALAWTGVKQSGRGCTLSVIGFEQVTRPKSFHLKRV
ncbi:MAG: aldehyde dehydrogenase family protein [Pseudomonadota bacterium]|nr:aldehyde dehydrogenase family protein [Pseudomonadota bacterium]